MSSRDNNGQLEMHQSIRVDFYRLAMIIDQHVSGKYSLMHKLGVNL